MPDLRRDIRAFIVIQIHCTLFFSKKKKRMSLDSQDIHQVSFFFQDVGGDSDCCWSSHVRSRSTGFPVLAEDDAAHLALGRRVTANAYSECCFAGTVLPPSEAVRLLRNSAATSPAPALLFLVFMRGVCTPCALSAPLGRTPATRGRSRPPVHGTGTLPQGGRKERRG